MLIYYEQSVEPVEFAVNELATQLTAKNFQPVIKRKIRDLLLPLSAPAIVISWARDHLRDITSLSDEGFRIDREGNTVFVTGKDVAGAMYGTLDLAETIAVEGWDAVHNKVENPYKAFRGIKFNLPFEPYDTGDPFVQNIETCLDPNFWCELIDFLARHRYNCLSLWSEHPFHMMFRLNKYPEACPYSDEELHRYQELYHTIFNHARQRCIQTWVITWNIRLTPFVAKALGLPEEVGTMQPICERRFRGMNGLPDLSRRLTSTRQHLEVVKDYFRECIKTLLMTYPELTGIGTTCSEEMTGDAPTRQQWVADVYAEAVRECNHIVPFIHRTNQSNGKVTVEHFVGQYPGPCYISWKYSNAHMYSHPEPRFEELWNAWEGVNLEEQKLIYTVRNDDYHTLRAGDPEYIRAYFKGMDKPWVHGYYWGADGYIWARDFQHVPHRHITWRYDFEKHWFQFQLLGRLGYNPDVPDSHWEKVFAHRYGKVIGPLLFEGMRWAGKVIPPVNRLFWINYDFQWHPESLISYLGFKTILDFVDASPMPGVGTQRLRDAIAAELRGEELPGESPRDIIAQLQQAQEKLQEIIDSLEEQLAPEERDDEVGCTLLDLQAWRCLAAYYRLKFSAAAALVRFELRQRESDREEAVALLTDALQEWRQLAEIGASHYLPYRMVRSKYTFGWSY
ncbi:MAG: hypothetical protein D6820_10910, partial [Lentisphaerae bacterium]